MVFVGPWLSWSAACDAMGGPFANAPASGR